MVRGRPASCAACPREPVAHLTAVVRQVLGEHDLAKDFFSAGGNSLTALTLARTAQVHGFRLGIRALFRAPSLRQLVGDAAGSAGSARPPGEPNGRAPLLPFQRWMFGLDPGTAARLAVVSTWRTTQPVEPKSVAEAIRGLPALHDALRTRVRRDGDGSGHQELTGRPMLDVDVAVADRFDEPPDRQDLVAAARQRLDLENGPSALATVLADPAGEHTELLLVTHHAVSDFVSHDILVAEVEGLLRGDDASRMGDATSSHGWAARLERYQTSAEVLAEEEYWGGVRDRSWPGPYATRRPGAAPGTGRRVTAEFGTRAAASVGALRRHLGLTHTELMLMAASWVFGGDPRQLLVGMSTHGRYPAFDGIELHNTVGWLSSNVSVSVPAVGDDPVRWRGRLRAELAGIPHYGVGVFGAEWVRRPDRLTRLLDSVTPFININVVHVATQPDRWWHVRVRSGQGSVVRPRGPALRLFVLVGDGSPDSVRLSMDYNDAYFGADEATGIVDELVAAPGRMAARFGLA